MNILQKIFKDHYEELIYFTHPRYSVIENVDKMSANDLLDMDYFLNEDEFDDEVGEEGFYIF